MRYEWDGKTHTRTHSCLLASTNYSNLIHFCRFYSYFIEHLLDSIIIVFTPLYKQQTLLAIRAIAYSKI